MNLQTALSWLTRRDVCTGPFGLHRMEYLMDRLGDPQNDVPCVLIGGTNGKGSVTAILEGILSATNFYRTGSTISPHLVEAIERIRISGTPPDGNIWVEGIEALEDPVKVMDAEPSIGSPSFFELVTALAFWTFRELELDIAFVEVGLGGRLDATNISTPEISVITNIGTDHKEFLGPDRPTIAREKLGILRKKRALVTAERDEEILGIMREECGSKKSKLVEARPGNSFSLLESRPDGHLLRFEGTVEPVHLPLPGVHQLENLAVALEVVTLLRNNGFEIPTEAVVRGIPGVFWPARLQWFPGKPPILVDGAHNHEGLGSLVEYLRQFPLPQPSLVILGALQKKPVEEMARELAKFGSDLVFVPPTCNRAINEEDFRALVQPTDSRWTFRPTLSEALEGGKNSASILIAGSLYLAADFLRIRG